MDFTKTELQLLYSACMSYGNKLTGIVKAVPDEEEIINGLVERAKESYTLARKITDCMEVD